MSANIDIRVTCMPWDHVTLLKTREVAPKGWDLHVDCHDRVWDWTVDERYGAGELSLSRYVRGLASGDDSIVALPLFLMRGFRQRCILVGRESKRRTLSDLVGTRIGVPGWADTGNTWTRAVLREAGIGLDQVEWVVGLAFNGAAQTIRGAEVPDHVRLLRDSENIYDELLAGRLDSVFFPFLPIDFHRGGFPLRHLFDDFAGEERDYYARVGYEPGLHLLGVRRSLLQQHPWLAADMVELFADARRRWIERRAFYADTTPWLLDEIERSMDTFGGDWSCNGVGTNQVMLEAFCKELSEQHVLGEPLAAEAIFADFAEFAAAGMDGRC